MKSSFIFDRENFSWFWIELCFIFNFFFPTFSGYFGTLGSIFIQLGLILSLLVWVFLIEKKQIFFFDSVEKKNFFIILRSYWFIGLLMLVSPLLSRHVIVFRDMFEIHRPVLISLTVLIPFAVIKSYVDVVRLRKVMKILFFGMIVLGIIHYFHLFDSLMLLYMKQKNIPKSRVTAPFLNPYDYGLIMLLFMNWFCYRFYKKGSNLDLFLVFVASILIFLTESRAIFIGMVVSVGLFFMVVLSQVDYKRFFQMKISKSLFRAIGLLFIVLTLFALTFLVFNDLLDYLTKGIMSLIKSEHVNSFSKREEQMLFVIDSIKNNPYVFLYGNGPAKFEIKQVESIYVYYMFRYGLLGIIAFHIPLFMALFKLGRIVFAKSSRYFIESVTVWSWLISLMFVSIGNNFAEQVRVMFLYIFLLGFSVRLNTLHNRSKVELIDKC